MKTYVTLTFLVVFGFALIAGLSSPINPFTSPTQASADPCDWDGDGYTSISCGGEDCNDFNNAVHPGATEDCNNRWDDDCDGDTNMQAQQDECANLGMSWFAPTCTCNPSSPIIIDLLGNGFHLTNAQGGVNFDINNDGQAERLSWTAAGTDDAFLVLDRNGNGAIDGGAELFGNFTAQPLSEDPNGFIALAEFDKAENGGNGDKAISASDTIFALLRLWEDSNHNGVSEPGELHSLGDKSISSVELKYKISRRVDQYGNAFLYRAKVHDLRGANVGKWAWDVFLLTQ
jgi:hypothetical protein